MGKFGNPLNKEENKGPAPSGAAVELHSDYLYRDVEARKLAIRVTSPTPILTPFDYLLFKCKDLMTEILLFISKYDEYFLVTAPFTRETLFTSYVYQGVKFPKPIDDLGAHFCIGKLFDMIQLLESHTPLPQESAENGWERRRRIIAQVVPPNRTRDPRKDLSTRLHGLAGDLNYSTYRPDQDPDLAYLTNEYLSALADDIEKTARRMYNDMMKDRTSPRSFEYRYMGSKEV